MRLKHQQADGFTVYASKTIVVPLDVLVDAFVNPRVRRKWLTDGTMSLRTSQPKLQAPTSAIWRTRDFDQLALLTPESARGGIVVSTGLLALALGYAANLLAEGHTSNSANVIVALLCWSASSAAWIPHAARTDFWRVPRASGAGTAASGSGCCEPDELAA